MSSFSRWTMSVDPGKKQSGIAFFEGTELRYAALLKVRAKGIKDPAQYAHKQYVMVEDQLFGFEAFYDKEIPIALYVDTVVVERMQVDGRTGTSQAMAILDLSMVAGVLSAHSADPPVSIRPSVWNKNRAKGPNQSRILRRLSAEEMAALCGGHIISDTKEPAPLIKKSLRPDGALYEAAVAGRVGQVEHVIDAIGIGLYHLGRL